MAKARNFFICMILFVICACSSVHKNDPVSLGNKIADAIEVTFQTGPEIKPTEWVEFWIKNTSHECIVFPLDYGIKLVIDDAGAWIEVKNLVEYQGQPGQTGVYLRPAGNIFSEKIVGALPDLSNIDLSGPLNFQVIITGHLCDDQSVVIEKRIPFIVKK